jgi:hypothetical protein
MHSWLTNRNRRLAGLRGRLFETERYVLAALYVIQPMSSTMGGPAAAAGIETPGGPNVGPIGWSEELERAMA